jgi:hypothetical protein
MIGPTYTSVTCHTSTHPIPAIGQSHLTSLLCHFNPSCIPSTHQFSSSSRSGRPVSRPANPFRPTSNVASPRPPLSSFNNASSRTGGKENGKSRFPRSASGDPRVQSSQSNIPITSGLVGWNICHVLACPPIIVESISHQVIQFEVSVNYSADTILDFFPSEKFSSRREPSLQLFRPPNLSHLHALGALCPTLSCRDFK